MGNSSENITPYTAENDERERVDFPMM